MGTSSPRVQRSSAGELLRSGRGWGAIFSEDRSDSGCLEPAEGRPVGVGGRWRRPQGRAGPGRLGGSYSRSFSGHLDDGAGA